MRVAWHSICALWCNLHICKHGRCNCSHSSLYPTSKFRQSGGHRWNVNSILYVPPEQEKCWCKVRGTKWSSYRNASANPFLWKPYIQEVPKCKLKIKRCSILLGQHVIGNCSNMLRYNSIHISFGERYRDVSLYKCS